MSAAIVSSIAARPWGIRHAIHPGTPQPGRHVLQRRYQPLRTPHGRAAFQGGKVGAEPGQPALSYDAVMDLPTLASVLELVRARPSLSSADLGLALLRAESFFLKDSMSVAERAMTEELVRLGWSRLAQGWQASELVNLLRLAAHCDLCTPSQMRAWLATFRSSKAVDKLYPKEHIYLLNGVWSLHTSTSDKCKAAAALFPRKVLAINVWRLCQPTRLERLGLQHLSMLYRRANDLGIRLTEEQHARLAAAVGARLAQEPCSVAIASKLLTAWARMEKDSRGGWRRVAPGARLSVQSAGGVVPLDSLKGPEELEGLPFWAVSDVEVQAEKVGQGEANEDSLPPVPGYPGDCVMEAVVAHLYAQRHTHTQSPWVLAQAIGALGALRYMPPPGIMSDLVAGATAALSGLAWLNFDPGEEFAEVCFQEVVQRGGGDLTNVCFTAWALATLKRCTPARWEALASLADSSLAGLDFAELSQSSASVLRLKTLHTVYLLLNERPAAGGAIPLGQASQQLVAAQQGQQEELPSEQQQQQQAPLQQEKQEQEPAPQVLAMAASSISLEASPSIPVMDVGTAGGPTDVAAHGKPAEQLPVALPAALKPWCESGQAGWLRSAGALHPQAPSPALAHVQDVKLVGKVVREMCSSSGRGYSVITSYHAGDPANSGGEQVVDVAVPQCQLAVRVRHEEDLIRNTGALLGPALIQERLLANWGWEVISLPPAAKLAPAGGSPEQRRQQVIEYLLRHTDLVQLLGAKLGDSGVIPGQGGKGAGRGGRARKQRGGSGAQRKQRLQGQQQQGAKTKPGARRQRNAAPDGDVPGVVDQKPAQQQTS